MKNLTVYTMHENLTLALYSAQSIGCNIVNIDAHDLSKGKPHLVLGLLWQIIRVCTVVSFSHPYINCLQIHHVMFWFLLNTTTDWFVQPNYAGTLPGVDQLARRQRAHWRVDETFAGSHPAPLGQLPAGKVGHQPTLRQFQLRHYRLWSVHVPAEADRTARCRRHDGSLEGNRCDQLLLFRLISPSSGGFLLASFFTCQPFDPTQENDLLRRAELMLQQADKLGCRSFLTPKDVVDGVYKLNLAFVANLFNNHPALHADSSVPFEV